MFHELELPCFKTWRGRYFYLDGFAATAQFETDIQLSVLISHPVQENKVGS
jgi:hypothetical protein